MKYNKTNLSQLYDGPEIVAAAFEVIVARLDTDTATNPEEIPAIELTTSPDRVAARKANLGGQLASALFSTNMDPGAVKFFIGRAGQVAGRPSEEVDIAVAAGLLSISAQLREELNGNE